MPHRRMVLCLLVALLVPTGAFGAPNDLQAPLVLSEDLVGSVILRGTRDGEGCSFGAAPMSIHAGNDSVTARFELGEDCALVLTEYHTAAGPAYGGGVGERQIACRQAPCAHPRIPAPSSEGARLMAEDEADAAGEAVDALASDDCRDPECRPDAKAATGTSSAPVPLSGCTWSRTVTGRIKTDKTWLKVDARFDVGCSSPARSQVTPLLGTCRAPGWRYEVIACGVAARVTPAWPDSSQWGVTGSYYKKGREVTFWHGMTDVLDMSNAGSLRCHMIVNGDTPGGWTWYCGNYFY
jgi:hypothetical protein